MRRAALGVALALLAGCGDAPARLEPTGLEPLGRPDDPFSGRLYTFEPTDVVLTHGTARFLVHYTVAGTNAVDPTDADASGVPDDVELVGDTYEASLDAYEALGFQPPVSDAGLAQNGGDGRFDVYLLDFAGIADGTFRQDAGGCSGEVCGGYMVQENDFVGYGYASFTEGTRVVTSHEFFHAIQAGYDTGQGPVFDEGSAVWATETFDPTLDDFEGFLPGYFKNTDRPLDDPPPGPADTFRYASAIFFQYLSERFDPSVVRELWEAVVDGAGGAANPYWLTALDGVLQPHGSTFADAFTEFSGWNLFTAGRADPARSYANGADYPTVTVTPEVFPATLDTLRLYRASAQYFRFDANGRTQATFAMAPEAGDDLAGLRGLVFTQSGPAPSDPIAPVVVWDPASPLDVTFEAGGRVFVILVNTAVEGQSKKPLLCAGTGDELAACPSGAGGGGAGGGGAGGAGGGGGDAGSGGGDPGASGGCQCALDGPPRSNGGLAAAALLGALLLRRRGPERRRRSA